MRALALFLPKPSFLFEEVGINMNSSGPYSSIDVLLLSQGSLLRHSHTGFILVTGTHAVVHAASN